MWTWSFLLPGTVPIPFSKLPSFECMLVEWAVKRTISVAVSEVDQFLVAVEAERAVWASGALLPPVHTVVFGTAFKFIS
jgi:hypothetical protein